MINVTIHWADRDEAFHRNRYSRAHDWVFDGGAVVPASSSPDIVPVPMSDPSAVDPEEAFVASIASCHMLWFLSIAAKAGFVVNEYRDVATGEMAPNDQGKLFIASVTLRPEISWGGDNDPTSERVARMHQKAHGECFIANSVITEIRIDPA